jgi:hypothetical protein
MYTLTVLLCLVLPLGKGCNGQLLVQKEVSLYPYNTFPSRPKPILLPWCLESLSFSCGKGNEHPLNHDDVRSVRPETWSGWADLILNLGRNHLPFLGSNTYLPRFIEIWQYFLTMLFSSTWDRRVLLLSLSWKADRTIFCFDEMEGRRHCCLNTCMKIMNSVAITKKMVLRRNWALIE